MSVIDLDLSSLTLKGVELEALFPAYLRLDGDGRIVAAGPWLRDRTNGALVGAAFFEAIEVERPAGVTDLATLGVSGRALVLRLAADPAIRLRGVALSRPDGLWLLAGHAPDPALADDAQRLARADVSPADGKRDTLIAADKRAADRASVADGAFLATMGHEIRTPMNAVLGLAELLAATDLTAAQRDMLDVMTASGRALMDRLNDALDLSKIESGRMNFEEAAFDAAALAQGVGRTFEAAAAAKGLYFDLVVDAAWPWRRGDPVRLRQIFVNLIANAIKFTESGGVRVHARVDDAGLALSVRDTGIGMSPEALERLFPPFAQAAGSTTRRSASAGLGLAITRLLCDQMGGAICVESRLGRGSTFVVELPLPKAAPPAAQGTPREAGHGDGAAPHALVVEDNPTNQFVMTQFLGKIGATFDLARDGAEALLAWERRDYDVILMDIEMPKLDGLEATRELRRREAARGGARTPIIGLSADATIESELKARKAGMDDFMTKPVEIERLRRLIRPARDDASVGVRRGAGILDVE